LSEKRKNEAQNKPLKREALFVGWRTKTIDDRTRRRGGAHSQQGSQKKFVRFMSAGMRKERAQNRGGYPPLPMEGLNPKLRSRKRPGTMHVASFNSSAEGQTIVGG